MPWQGRIVCGLRGGGLNAKIVLGKGMQVGVNKAKR